MKKSLFLLLSFTLFLTGCSNFSSMESQVTEKDDITLINETMETTSVSSDEKEPVFQKIDLGHMVEGQKFFSFVINTETNCIYVLQTERDLRLSKATEQVLTHRNLTPIAEQTWDNESKKCVGYYQDKLNEINE